jgi:predicted esterase
MIASLFVAAPLLAPAAPAPQAPSRTTPASGRVRGLDGEDLGSDQRFDWAVGGNWSMPWTPPAAIRVLGPGVYEIDLNLTETGWQERFLLALPQNGVSYAPLLVLFHGYGQEPEQLLTLTSYVAEAQARGWFVVAPLGAHKFNFGIEYAQRNIEEVLEWTARYLPIDTSRIYGVGFSMGGGGAASYAARHVSPAHARFAALVNHTGTTSIRDVWWNAGDQNLLEHALMFGGTPDQVPFAYQRASSVDSDPLTQVVDPESDMVRNLSHLPVRTFAASGEPLGYLLAQVQVFHDQLLLRGGSGELVFGAGNLHAWSTLDETSVLDWLAQQTYADPAPGTLVETLADRDGRWFHFTIAQRQSGNFTPFRWFVHQPLNRLLLDRASNLRALRLDPGQAGLDAAQPLELVFQSSDSGVTSIVLAGYPEPPAQVLRNGAPLKRWAHDQAAGTLTFKEPNAAGYALWRIEP